jgi:hypothetical protein
MENITRFITQKLKLKVNEAKSAVARPQTQVSRVHLRGRSRHQRTIAPKSLDRFKQRIRDITRGAKGVSIKTTMEELAPYVCGWRNYFGFCETPEVLIALTRWVRLRLRAALWRQWKTPRRRRAALIALRVSGELRNMADSGRGPWHLARSKALSVGLANAHFKFARSPLLDRSTLAQLLEPPYTDVVWEGRSREAPPYPDRHQQDRSPRYAEIPNPATISRCGRHRHPHRRLTRPNRLAAGPRGTHDTHACRGLSWRRGPLPAHKNWAPPTSR